MTAHLVVFFLAGLLADGKSTKRDSNALEVKGPGKKATEVHEVEMLSDFVGGMKQLFDGNAICGGTTIGELLTTDVDLGTIRTLPWGKIMKIASNYIEAQTWEVQRLTELVKKLEEQIETKKQEEKPEDLTQDQMNQLITKAVAHKEGFISLDLALESNCGAVRYGDRQRFRRSNTRKVKTLFNAAAESIFSGGEIRTNGGVFRTYCDTVLPGDSRDSLEDTSYCDELCQDFADSVSKLSDKYVGSKAGLSSDELRVKHGEALAKLNHAKKELTECKEAEVTLSGFHFQLEDMGFVIKRLSDDFQIARENVMDAEDDLDDLDRDLAQQDKAFTTMCSMFDQSEGKVQELKEKLADAQQKDKEATDKLKECANTLGEAKRALTRAVTASTMIEKVKSSVSNVMFQMVLYFEAAVRVPMGKLGLTVETDIDSFFAADSTQTQKAKDARESIGTVKSYCTETAEPTFDSFDEIRMKPLCQMGELASITQEVDDAVTTRVAAMKQNLKDVQTLLKLGTREDLKEESINARVEQGEPRGLVDTLGVFGLIPFYKNYLLKWKLGNEFQQLIAQMVTLVDELEQAREKAKNDLADAAAKATAANLNHRMINGLLNDAIEQNLIDANKKNEAQVLLAQATEANNEASERLAELQRIADAIEKELIAAKKALVETHKEGTNLIQFIEALDGPQK